MEIPLKNIHQTGHRYKTNKSSTGNSTPKAKFKGSRTMKQSKELEAKKIMLVRPCGGGKTIMVSEEQLEDYLQKKHSVAPADQQR